MIPHDKILHALVGAVIFSASYALFHLAALPALEIAACAVVLAAVGKELHDRWANLQASRAGLPPPHGVELADALWTVAGGAIPALPIIVERLGR